MRTIRVPTQKHPGRIATIIQRPKRGIPAEFPKYDKYIEGFHIVFKGIIRELINNDRLLIVVTQNNNQDEIQVARNLVNKLTSNSSIHVILVNKERQGTSNFWIDEIKNIVKDINTKKKIKMHD